jgi:hypothetical protein
MSEEREPEKVEEKKVDFVVDPLSDEDLDDVSGGATDGGCSDGGGCSSGYAIE